LTIFDPTAIFDYFHYYVVGVDMIISALSTLPGYVSCFTASINVCDLVLESGFKKLPDFWIEHFAGSHNHCWLKKRKNSVTDLVGESSDGGCDPD
jgi:hypothetical protein